MKLTSSRSIINPVIKFILALVLLISTGVPIVRNILIFENKIKPKPIPWVIIDQNRDIAIAKLQVEHDARIERERIVVEKERLEKLALESKQITKTVFLVNYYQNDSSGSGAVTASGLRTSQFQVNELGWYVYKNKVVVAAATNYCLRLKTGICGRWNVLPKNWISFDLYDEITIIYNGKEYAGIIADTCGACFYRINNEKYQRFDVFISRNPFGKVLGQVRY